MSLVVLPSAALDATRVTCPTCRSLVPTNDDLLGDSIDHIQQLHNVEALRDITGDVLDEYRHAARVSSVVAIYRLPPSEWVQCSFPDRRKHHEGLVVRTLCDRVMNVGRVCGQNNVAGFDRIMTIVTRKLALRSLEQSVAPLIERAERTYAAVVELQDMRQVLRVKLPAVADEMTRRRRANNATVLVPVRGQKIGDRSLRRNHLDERLITGLDLWATAPGPTQGLSAAHALRGQRAKQLQSTLPAVHEQVVHAEVWVRNARGFFSESNLALALHAARVEMTPNDVLILLRASLS